LNYCDLIISPLDPINIGNIEAIQECEYEHLFPIPSTLTTCYGRVKIQTPTETLMWHDQTRRTCEYCGTLNTGVLTGFDDYGISLDKHSTNECPFTAGDSAETARKLLIKFNRNMEALNKFVKKRGIIEKLRKDFPFIQFPDTYIECLFYQDGTRYNLQLTEGGSGLDDEAW
jgi:hypothetical protein